MHRLILAGLCFSACAAAIPGCARAASPLEVRAREAHQFVVDQMDLWTSGTVVVDERASGGAGFYPTNRSGDVGDLELDDGCTAVPARGTTCLALTYDPHGPQGHAEVVWTYPDRPVPDWGNWGQAAGRDITGARRLRGFIRGRKGGEHVELLMGGVNREPHHDAKKPFQDSFGPVSIHKELGTHWEPFSLEIPSEARCESVIGGFGCAFSKLFCPAKTTIYLDDVRFDDAIPDVARLVRSYVPVADRGDDPIRNAAFLYDNALLLLYFCACDDAQSARRARLLADSIVDAQSHDRSDSDGRWRNAYSCGPLIDPATETARLPAVYSPEQQGMREDRYTVSTDTGNMAWAIIGLLAAHQRFEAGRENPPHRYLNAARRAARWLDEHCRADDDLGGYSGGYEGWELSKSNSQAPHKLAWRSTEHNLDLAVALEKLSRATSGEERRFWHDRGRHARKFVFAMWNAEGQHFWVGIRDCGGTRNRDAIAADVHAWSLLALGHDLEFRRLIAWSGPGEVPCVLAWVEAHCREEGGGVSGYRFSDRGKGIWPEGCSQMAACYRYLGDNRRAEAILGKLLRVSPSGSGPGEGTASHGILAAHAKAAETGFIKEFYPGVAGKWNYPRRQHLGATAWFLLAMRAANPYWLEGLPSSAGEADARHGNAIQ